MKVYGFFNRKKKLSDKFFRNVFANGIIAVVLISLFFLTYSGGVLNTFTSNADTAIYTGNTESKKICLMINVYWGNEYLDNILNTLEINNIHTTFFIGGTWAEQFPQLLQKIYQAGHELANHGYYHKDHKNISYERNKEEIQNTHNLIKNQTGIEMNLFAPPSGSYSTTTLEIVESLGYKTIMWTRDTIDWRDQDSDLIYNRAIKNASGGDLILMHPTEMTTIALPDIIKTLTEQGFELTTVSNCLI